MAKHHDGQDVEELRNFLFKKVTTDPTGANIVEGMIPYLNTVEDRLKYSPDGTNLKTIATLEDVTSINSYRGVWDASTGIPTAAGSTVRPGDSIKAGDFWRVSVGGTITGIQGLDTVVIHDVIYAEADDAATAADFAGIQGNDDTNSGNGAAKLSQKTLASLPAATATDVTPDAADNMTTIYGYHIFDSAGVDMSDSFDVVLDNVAPKITITSLIAYTNLDIKFVGS